MKTIEEKAKEYSQEFGSSEFQEVSYNSFMCGADTQKKIDIDKACEWLIEHFNRTILSSGDCVFEEKLFTTEIEEEFRKAMEE